MSERDEINKRHGEWMASIDLIYKNFLNAMSERALKNEMLIKQNPPAQQPWSCPRCTRIYGPSVQICVPCNTAVAAREAK
jgi:hypothetical protein